MLVCAADLPFVTAEALGRLAGAEPMGRRRVRGDRARAGLQPLLGR